MVSLGLSVSNVCQKLQKIRDKIDNDQPQNYVIELQVLLEEIDITFKILEDKRLVTERRVRNLLAENQQLNARIEDDKKSLEQAALRLESLEASFKNFNQLTNDSQSVLKKYFETADKSTTTTTETSTLEECCKSVHNICNITNLSYIPENDTNKLTKDPTVTIKRSELCSLESDMQALRLALVRREESWRKLLFREREQKDKMSKIENELNNYRDLAATRKHHLDFNSQALELLAMKFRKAQTENFYLKKELSRLNSSRSKEKLLNHCTSDESVKTESKCNGKIQIQCRSKSDSSAEKLSQRCSNYSSLTTSNLNNSSFNIDLLPENLL